MFVKTTNANFVAQIYIYDVCNKCILCIQKKKFLIQTHDTRLHANDTHAYIILFMQNK